MTKSVQIIKRKISNEINNYQYSFNFETPFFMCKTCSGGQLGIQILTKNDKKGVQLIDTQRLDSIYFLEFENKKSHRLLCLLSWCLDRHKNYTVL